MANQTVYDIRLRYLLDDKASKGLGKIADQGDRAARSSGALLGVLGRIGGLVVGTFGARAAGKALIGFNSDLEQAKITMAGMIQLNMGGSWAKNMQTATNLVGDFQQMAKASVGTTKDFVDMAQLITRPLTAAGGSMQDLKDATKGAVIASRAFNIDPEAASRDIESALQGTLTAKDRFARALLEPMGYDTTKFNALSATKRLDTLIKAFNSPAIKDMAKAQENSFSGVMSTFEDNIQMTVGKIGLPLFKALTEEVKSWNTWLDNNQDKVKEISESLAKGLVQGFGMVKDVISFLIDHKDTLLTLGKIWLAVKGAQAVGGIAGAFGGGAGGMIGAMGATPFSKGAGGAGGTLGALAFAGMAGWEAGSRMHDESEAFGNLMSQVNAQWAENLKMARAHEDLEREIKDLDDSVAAASARMKQRGGMWATTGAAYMQAEADRRRDALNRSRDAANGPKDRQYGFGSIFTGPLGSRLTGSSGMLLANYAAAGGGAKLQELQQQRAEASQRRATMVTQNAQMVYNNALLQLQRPLVEGLDVSRAQLDVMTMMQRTIGKNAEFFNIPGMAQFLTAKAGALMAQDQVQGSDRDRSKSKANKPNVHVTIQRIEVQSDDPDRLAFGLVESFRDAARNPSQAFDTLREG